MDSALRASLDSDFQEVTALNRQAQAIASFRMNSDVSNARKASI